MKFLKYILSFSAVGIFIPGLLYVNNLSSKIRNLEHKISTYKSVEEELTSARHQASSPDNSASRSWATLQPDIKNTVVQIFSHVAEFNFLEPYKTPNQMEGAGSGFFIDENRIITNAHVVDQSTVEFQVPGAGKKRFSADVVSLSPERDLALLRVKDDDLEKLKKIIGQVRYLKLGNSDLVHRAEEVMALGYPLGQSLKSTTGVVSGREQHMIQLSAAINPGNSGGPLLNTQGEVIGVNSAKYVWPAEGVGYAIQSNEVKIFINQAAQYSGKSKILRKPFLGILYNVANDDLTSYLSNPLPGGLYVVETVKRSPLEKAGIHGGDMIYEIDGYPVDVYGDLTVPMSEDKLSIVAYLSRLTMGDTIHLVVYRSGKALEFDVKLDDTEISAVRRVFPGYEKIEYEVIGGMVVMPLCLNHLPLLIKGAPELAKYADIKNQNEPALIITHVIPDSEAGKSRAIGAGSVIAEVNGKKVQTLEELRSAITLSASSGHLTIKTTEHIFTSLSFDQILRDEPKLASTYFYKTSPTILAFMQQKKAQSNVVA